MHELGVGTSFYGVLFIVAALLVMVLAAGLCGAVYLLIRPSKERTEVLIDKNINLTVNLAPQAQVSATEIIQRLFDGTTANEIRRIGTDRSGPIFLPKKVPPMLEMRPAENASDLLIEDGKLAESERSMIVRPLRVVPQRQMDTRKSPAPQQVRIMDRTKPAIVPYSFALNAYLEQMLSTEKIHRIISLKA